MAEFNPYQTWLQVAVSAGETPTYYKLLGLSEFEENLQTVSKAAEKQLSRLLAINPEKYRPQWQKLINDLAEAQSTLTHPQHKSNYDNRLRGVTPPETAAVVTSEPMNTAVAAATNAATSSTAPAYQAPAPQAPAYGAEQGYPNYAQPNYQYPNYANPSAAQPLYGQPIYQQPIYGQPQPPATSPPVPPPAVAPYAQPFGQPQYGQPYYGQPPQAPTYAQPIYGQPVAPASYSQPTYGQPVYNPAPAQPYGYAQPTSPVYEATAAHDPFATGGMPDPMAPVGGAGNFGSGGPGAYSASVNPMAPINNSRSPLPGSSQSYVEEDASFGEPLATPNPYRAPKQESPVKYLVGAILVAVFVIGGFVLKAKLGGNHSDQSVAQNDKPQDSKQGTPPREVVPVSTPAVPKPTDPSNNEPKNPNPLPVQPEPMPPEMIKPEPMNPEPMKPEPMKPEMPVPEPAMPEPEKPEPMKPVTPIPELTKPEPPKPEPPKPEPTVATAEEQKVIFAKLAEIRSLLGERNFADAKRELKQVKDLANTPDMQELHLGMDLVVDYTEQFWQAVQTSMRTLKGEIMVGSSLANVVNSEAGEITIRIAGANKNFKYASLPPGLALAIATKWFDNKPANKALLGAFYYVSRTGSIDEARKYWKEAGQGGVDVKYMLMLLDKPAIHGK